MLLLEKAENWEGSGLLRGTSSVSPTAQRRDCLNLAPCLVLSYVQMADVKLRDGFLLGQAFGQLQLQFSKAWSFNTTSYKLFPWDQVRGRKKNPTVGTHKFSSLHKVTKMCSGLFHKSWGVSYARWPSTPSGFTCKAIRHWPCGYLVSENKLTCCWSCVICYTKQPLIVSICFGVPLCFFFSIRCSWSSAHLKHAVFIHWRGIHWYSRWMNLTS